MDGQISHVGLEAPERGDVSTPDGDQQPKKEGGVGRVPRRLRDVQDDGRYVCVYAIGPSAGRPIKVGYATDVITRVSEFNVGHWEPIRAHYVLWTPGRPVAIRLEAECHRILYKAGVHIRGEWFDIPSILARDTIRVAAQNLNVPTFSHSQFLRRLEYRQRCEMEKMMDPFCYD